MSTEPVPNVLDELIQALEAVRGVHAGDVREMSNFGGGPRIEWVELRLSLGWEPTMGRPTSDAEARRFLYQRAEEAIAVAEGKGWEHIGAPRIDLDADKYHEGNELRFLHKCEVRLDMAKS